ncbi:unnamed protein product [Danaus chrysippus]|uniref:(African queen) hypothetical protein n=1 Tax=Danaus chrysippus TaxID=151541 RepID=A0A8J2W2B4_9NEOP|nr:unnamed protein product [Danaus chrysippus]
MTEEKEVQAENNESQDKENKNEDEQNKNAEVDNAEEESELDSSIIRQIEYYFGDLNLPRDKFLREQVKLDDGWVPLEVLTRFNRLAKLSTDIGVIANAISKSTSGLLEISDDNQKVRRNPELPIPEMNEERRKELVSRTIYAKGFGKDTSLDDILKYFKQFEEVENIIMRKYQDRKTKERIFKGSVFATFKTKDQADKFMETKDHKFNDTDLLVMWQDAYLEKKREEYANFSANKKNKNKNSESEQKEKNEFKLPTGTVLHFSQGHDKMTREDVKDALTPLGSEVAFISFKVGDTEGWVRLANEGDAKKVAEKIPDGKIKIGESEVVFRVLEGEEEKNYLDKTIEEMSKRRQNMKKQKKGGKPQYRKRKQDNHDDAPRAKTRAS